ncbi:hypothetical protein ACLOJK_037047 [Asimina triloba]
MVFKSGLGSKVQQRQIASQIGSNVWFLVDEDTLRRIVKLLSHEHSQEREEAVSLLWELSKSESLCEKIGGINGAILILVGMTSSKSENVLAVEKAEKLWRTLRNMAEIGRLQPLLALLLEGSLETKLTMASHLGDLVMSSDVKVFVARMVGPSLIDVMRSGNMHAREAALKALNQISSSDNTGPNIECKLLQVLVGLTSSPESVFNVVFAIKSSGAMISLIQFIEAPQRDLCVASMKLLHHLSPHMGLELANALCGTGGQLGSLIKVISENEGIIEEQVSAVALLEDLPERDSSLTRQMLGEGAFELVISKLLRIRQGESLSSRFVTPYLEGLIGILTRLTFILPDEPKAVVLAHQQPVITGLCQVHQGLCSCKESFCLLEGKAVGKLVACLDHTNDKVVEAALAAICTLLDDDVNIEQGVNVLCEAEGIKPILDVLLEHRTDILQQRSVWAVERILRTDEIAFEISGDQNVGTTLVDAFRNGDYRSRQIAEKALKHVDKIPNFSSVFQKTG